MDSEPELNRYEIIILDSIIFHPYKSKSGIIDPKRGFDFNGKKIAFFSCTKNSDTKGKGLLSKEEFFSFFKPQFKGHAGNGLITFNEKERTESKGFDAVIIIDCPYPHISRKELISQLIKKYH